MTTPNFTDKQQRAIDTDAPVVTCTAGAGAGKTRVLTARVQRLLAQGVYASRILALTFTRAAATEMSERVATALEDSGRDLPQICTVHSFCSTLLRQYAHLIGLSQEFTIYDAEDAKDIQRAIMRDLGITSHKTWRGATGKKAPEEQVLRLVREYERRLKSWNALDFAGLLGGALQVLSEHHEVVEGLRCEHVLVDESQDCNPAQWAIVNALSAKSLFVVGDIRQAIYSFQGARPDDLEELERSATSIVLPHNFRSGAAIVDVANITARGMKLGLPGMIAAGGKDSDVTRKMFMDREHRGLGVAEMVQQLATDVEDISQIAILARQWRSLEPVAEALIALGIPAKLSRGVDDLWKKPGAKTLINILRAAVNPRDGHSARAMLEEVRPEDAAGLRAAAHRGGIHLVDVDEDIAAAIAGVRERAGGAYWAADAAITSLGLTLAYRNTGRDSKAAEVNACAEAIRAWLTDDAAEGHPGGVQDLLDWLTHRDLQERALSAAQDGGPYLGTIHSAKGLEWDHVFLMDWRPRGDLEEERRCWYVGATRARRTLTVAWYGDPSPPLADVLGEVKS